MTKSEPTAVPNGRIPILGVPIDCLSMDECIARIGAFIEDGRPHLVVTADASGIVQSQRDEDLRKLYQSADLVTPDSAGVVWAMKRNGQPEVGRVSGVDIVDRVCAESADRGWRIFFLGAAPGVAELAAERQKLKHPGCNIVGTRNGYFPQESDAVVAAEIAALKPEILFVAMGIPRQEKFIRATESIIGASVAMGVGGTFDVMSGNVKRAPKLFQRMKLEWFWRLMLNPRKIEKVKLLPEFVLLVLRSGRH